MLREYIESLGRSLYSTMGLVEAIVEFVPRLPLVKSGKSGADEVKALSNPRSSVPEQK